MEGLWASSALMCYQSWLDVSHKGRSETWPKACLGEMVFTIMALQECNTVACFRAVTLQEEAKLINRKSWAVCLLDKLAWTNQRVWQMVCYDRSFHYLDRGVQDGAVMNLPINMSRNEAPRLTWKKSHKHDKPRCMVWLAPCCSHPNSLQANECASLLQPWKKKNTLHSELINKVFNPLTLTALRYLYSPSHDQVYLCFHQWGVALVAFQTTEVSQKHFSDLLISFVVSFKRNSTANACILSHTAAGIRGILARLLTFEKRKLFPAIHLVMGAEKATHTFTGKQSLSGDKNNSTTEAETGWVGEGTEGNRSRHRRSADEGIEIHSSCLPLSLSPSSTPPSSFFKVSGILKCIITPTLFFTFIFHLPPSFPSPLWHQICPS